jgi:hypothetical protein
MWGDPLLLAASITALADRRGRLKGEQAGDEVVTFAVEVVTAAGVGN